MDSFIFWIPLPTLVEFVIYIGWLDVAEKLLHPLGEGADDLECNYIIDKNLETGFTIVDGGGDPYPELEKDAFWDKTNIALLYSYETAKREVQPMSGSIANTK
uniref:Bestrophin homolog n=1 Tax=Panagrolaimus superbus TaxID=310955 RepID=A0A914XTP9_9BILA